MGFVGSALGIGKSGAEKASERAFAQFEDLQAPEIRDVALERLREVGDARNFVEQQGATEFDKINVDPRFREAQVGALDQLREIATQGGLTESDRARLEEIRRQEAVAEQGQREAILQNAAARGVAGSGLELASKLISQQGSADRASQADLGVADLAQQRVLQAIRDSANLAGGIRSQEFGEQAQRASAQDIINAFNTNTTNQAGLETFRNRQNVANQNVGISNQQQLLNRVELPQQRFGNEFDIRRARADALNRLASTTAQREGRFTQLVGAGIGAAGSALGRPS